MVTCRLTACTPGSAPGPTLGIEYGKPLPFTVASCHLCGTINLKCDRFWIFWPPSHFFSPIWGNLACYGEPEVCCSVPNFKLIDASCTVRNKFDQVWIFGGSRSRFHSLVRRNLRCESKPKATALLHQMLIILSCVSCHCCGTKTPKVDHIRKCRGSNTTPLLIRANFGMGEWTHGVP